MKVLAANTATRSFPVPPREASWSFPLEADQGQEERLQAQYPQALKEAKARLEGIAGPRAVEVTGLSFGVTKLSS